MPRTNPVANDFPSLCLSFLIRQRRPMGHWGGSGNGPHGDSVSKRSHLPSPPDPEGPLALSVAPGLTVILSSPVGHRRKPETSAETSPDRRRVAHLSPAELPSPARRCCDFSLWETPAPCQRRLLCVPAGVREWNCSACRSPQAPPPPQRSRVAGQVLEGARAERGRGESGNAPWVTLPETHFGSRSWLLERTGLSATPTAGPTMC